MPPNDDMPMISSSTYQTTALNLGADLAVDDDIHGEQGPRGKQGPRGDPGIERRHLIDPRVRAHARAFPQLTTKEEAMAVQRRLVQVIIIDPDENVPIEQCLLHRGESQLTDLTDQELYFEINVKQLLDAHNEKRVKLVNKKVKERVENLEPAKIRDLRMVVVVIASF